jgi:hypothetical protein
MILPVRFNVHSLIFGGPAQYKRIKMAGNLSEKNRKEPQYGHQRMISAPVGGDESQ